MLARPPAGAPAGGCVACRVPAPGLPPSSPMPRGPPPRAPPPFPECMDADGNRIAADSCAPVGPAAASGPGFHICWPPSGPRVSARAIPVSVDGRGPPADARVPRFTMNFFPRRNTRAALSRDPQTRNAKWARGSRSQTHRRAAKGGFTQDDVKVRRTRARSQPRLFLAPKAASIFARYRYRWYRSNTACHGV